MAYRYLEQSDFLTPMSVAATTEAAQHPARYTTLTEAPHVHWRSTNLAATTLTVQLTEAMDVYGVALLGLNAAASVAIGAGAARAAMPTIDPLDGIRKSLVELPAAQEVQQFTVSFAANAARLDGVAYFRLGTLIVLGAALTELDNAPLRPSPEEWETEEEENLEEKQRLLPPETLVDWEARPQTQADFNRWSDLVYRRDLQDLVLWDLPGASLFLARIERDIEREDYVTNFGYWRMRWLVL